MEYRRNSRGSSAASAAIPWPLAALGVAAALLLAPPALLVGLAARRLTPPRPWSLLLWFALSLAGAGLVSYFAAHGLDRSIVALLADALLAVKRRHADIARLWSEAWPVWLRTLAAAPAVALWRELAARSSGDGAGLLLARERERQRRAARSKNRAERRASRPGRLPDAVGGSMVVGVPIDDEDAG